MTDKMIATKEGPIGWVTFNNPERRNAVGVSMWRAIPEILDDFEKDDAIRVIVLRGAGDKAFVAGADISEFEELRDTAEAQKRYGELSSAAQQRIMMCTKPTVAMIHGFCVGGGVAIALNCDMRVADESSVYSIPAARLGLGYSARNIKKLIDVVGTPQAKEIFYTARRYTAQEAFRIGLVNALVPDAELETTVREYCAKIADNAPMTIRAVKEAVFELNKPQGEPDFARTEELVQACFDSEDYTEGRRAFMEKRRPVFRGR